jgi:hypothetical protein
MQDNSLPNFVQPTSSAPVAPAQPHVDDYIPPTITPATSQVVDPIVAVNPVVTNPIPVIDPEATPEIAPDPIVPNIITAPDPINEYSSKDFQDPIPTSDSPIVGSDPALTNSAPTDSAPTDSAPIDSAPDQASARATSDDSSSIQKLETQNIFDLLGVSDGTQKEKEDFLDELQEVIWEDFVESDIELLLTEEEGKGFAVIKAKGETLEVQEEMLVFLEKLIPDLEEIMMDKALELKAEMVQERISGMREFHADNQEAITQIEKAEKSIVDDRWAEVSTILNGIT